MNDHWLRLDDGLMTQEMQLMNEAQCPHSSFVWELWELGLVGGTCVCEVVECRQERVEVVSWSSGVALALPPSYEMILLEWLLVTCHCHCTLSQTFGCNMD